MYSEDERLEEQAKYERAYDNTAYHMSDARLAEAREATLDWPAGSLLDIGCGRGEYLDLMRSQGFEVTGVERVPSLCEREDVVRAWAHSLPLGDESCDFCTSWDVLEHLLPGDDELMLREMRRVCRKGIAVSANNKTVFKESLPGQRDELHINRRSYSEWDAMLRDTFRQVTFFEKRYSPIWVAEK